MTTEERLMRLAYFNAGVAMSACEGTSAQAALALFRKAGLDLSAMVYDGQTRASGIEAAISAAERAGLLEPVE